MRITLLIAAATILAAVHDLGDPGALDSPSGSPGLHARGVEAPATEVRVGDIAPNFSYQGVDARWRRLRDLTAEAPVLLVFGANEGTLRIIERERDALMDLGVIPVAVVDARIGAARAMVQRHQLRYTVLADPRGVIASQFNAVDPASGRQLATWFVLDPARRVRALGRRGLPLRGYAELAATALGIPAKSATVPAAR